MASCSAAAILSGLCLAEPAVAVDVLDRERLLEPVELVLGEAARHLERVLELPAAPDVDHDVDVRPGGLAGRGDELDVAARVEAERAPAELERAVPALDLRRDVAPHRIRRLRHERARVDAHAVAEAAAEQPVDGLAERAADEVVERDVDRRDRVDRGGARAGVRGRLVEVVPDRLDVERIAAEQRLAHADEHRVRRGHVDEGLGDGRRGVGLAVAAHALVRVDADDERVLRAVGAQLDLGQAEVNRLDVGDAHLGADHARPAVARLQPARLTPPPPLRLTPRSVAATTARRSRSALHASTRTPAHPAQPDARRPRRRRRRGRGRRHGRVPEHDDRDRIGRGRRAPPRCRSSSSRGRPARTACRCRAPTTASRGRSPTTTRRSRTA